MECIGQNSTSGNHSTLMEFILVGFSDVPNHQGFLFCVFLIIYVFILLGNSFIIMITKVDSTLQTPMYFFLGNFSFLEICYVSVTMPRLLADLCGQHRNISLLACAVQMYFFQILVDTECFILTAMAYDRYVAICNPLLYPVIMNNRLCIQLALVCWTTAIPVDTMFISVIFSSTFCGCNQLNHFFCDSPAVVRLVCGNAFMIQMWMWVLAVIIGCMSSFLILSSYVKIFSTIMKLPSATGRAKAFSTCCSHLTVVTLFFGSGFIVYFRSTSSHSTGTDKFLSLFYTILIPMLNPIHYLLSEKQRCYGGIGKIPTKIYFVMTQKHNFLKIVSYVSSLYLFFFNFAKYWNDSA